MKVNFDMIRGIGIGFAQLDSCGHTKVFGLTILMFQFFFIFGMDAHLHATTPTAAPSLLPVPGILQGVPAPTGGEDNDDVIRCNFPMFGLDYKFSKRLMAQTNPIIERLPELLSKFGGHEQKIGSIECGECCLVISAKVETTESILSADILSD